MSSSSEAVRAFMFPEIAAISTSAASFLLKEEEEEEEEEGNEEDCVRDNSS